LSLDVGKLFHDSGNVPFCRHLFSDVGDVLFRRHRAPDIGDVFGDRCEAALQLSIKVSEAAFDR
jgi:hypothetical protein